MCFKIEENRAILSEYPGQVLELCLYSFKLYVKATMDPFFLFSKMSILHDLLADIRNSFGFYDSVFLYLSEQIGTCHREFVNSTSNKENFLNQSINMSNTFLIFILNYVCFYDHSDYSFSKLSAYLLKQLNVLRELIFFIVLALARANMHRSHQYKTYESFLENIALLFTIICYSQNFNLMVEHDNIYEDENSKTFFYFCSGMNIDSERKLIEKFESFYLRTLIRKNEFQLWTFTYCVQFFSTCL